MDLKIIFLKSLVDREEQLCEAMSQGIETEGDEFIHIAAPKEPRPLGADLVAFVGMKRIEWFRYCRDNGQPYMYFDKGYYHREFAHRKRIILWRTSVNSQQPTEYVAAARHSPDRWLDLGRRMESWRRPHPHGHIIIANSSEKYHEFFGLSHPTQWVIDIVRELRKHTDRPIWYRPKPSWRGAEPIEGTRYCPREPLSQLFPGCHAIITHGSYIAVDALLHGIPGIVLGDAVTRPISSTSLAEIESPRLVSDEERMQVLANMAWCQYNIKEWRSGFAWQSIKRLFLQ